MGNTMVRVFTAIKNAALAAVMVIFAMGASASATVISQGPPPDGAPGFSSNFGVEQSSTQVIFTNDALITNLRWWGNDFDGLGEADDFTIRLFSDVGGAPSIEPTIELTGLTVLESATGLFDDFGVPIIQYDAAFVSPLDVMAGAFFLSIVNNFLGDSWLWSTFNTDGDNFFRFVDGEPWEFGGGGALAFEITTQDVGEIPIGFAWIYFLSAFAGFAGIRRTRHKSA